MVARAGRGPRGERGAQSDRILAAARKSFAEHGYSGTSLRAVAQAADVDPTPVNYYFTGRRGRWSAELSAPADGSGRVASRVPFPTRPSDRLVGVGGGDCPPAERAACARRCQR
ncbi:TetR family transcriptional regulator [Streptomyces sp. NPDC020801]|uniref:TetR family transcriptional regulator n=1 Tax=unclassified Streptomyces TaxID=2593676 RepID=UPI0037AD9159